METSSETYTSVSQKLKTKKSSFHEHIKSILLSKNVFEGLRKEKHYEVLHTSQTSPFFTQNSFKGAYVCFSL